MDVTGQLNEAIGGQGPRVESNVQKLGKGYQGKKGTTKPGKKKDGNPGIEDAFLLKQASGSGTVGLDGGQVEVGGARVDLGEGNTANVDVAGGGEKLGVSFVKLLLDSLQLSTGETDIDVRNVKASKASANVTTGQGQQTTDARAERVSTGQVKGTF